MINVRDAYTSWATSYDHDPNSTRDLDRQVTTQILGQQRAEYLLELGCGTGKNTQFLATIATHVHALDFTEAMLAHARAKVPAPNVTFALADLTQPWPCANQTYDLIVANLVLEHIADLEFIFAEVRRCLKAEGHFFLCELHPAKQYQGLQANFTRDEAEVRIPAYLHHLTDYLEAAATHGLRLHQLREWWHPDDRTRPPRLLSLLFDGRIE